MVPTFDDGSWEVNFNRLFRVSPPEAGQPDAQPAPPTQPPQPGGAAAAGAANNANSPPEL